MKKTVILFTLLVPTLTVGALCTKQATALDRCYALTGDPDQTIIRIIDKPGDEYTDIIIISGPTGQDAEQSLGKIEDETFFYVTPGKWLFDENQIRGEGSILEGIAGTVSTCPDLDEYEYLPQSF